MKTPTYFLPGVLLLACLGSAHAQDADSQFNRYQGDGYYWYKKEAEAAAPKKPASAPKPVEANAKENKPAQLKPLSVAWIKANMPILLEKAIEDPTRENVSNYMYAQRVVLDRSQAFSDMATDVVASDGYLDENNRVPMAAFAQNTFILQLAESKRAAMKFLSTKTGVWVFVDKPDKCRACATYVNDIVKSNVVGLETKFGFNVRVIDVSSPGGMIAAQRFNLKLTPTTMLVSPPDSYYIVSQGLMAATTLQDKILVAARMNGVLDKSTIESIEPYSKGLITKETLNSAEYSDDPAVVMSKFRTRLTGDEK
ncbi:conjugal transfer protein TraF [Rhodoferax antarcticus]|uniref:Uncharacterized protein n=1 Tax=Rhodoferax antarcticus ANT.BR TaxID=1111071 RepID=A0A1Q8Y8X8_9BURK|nr:conjugal transfer protein TraF [Rhodoferax antarcticus]OLP04475.1 hypothetical protein BLL52_4204 [Rhodoferax antarcticus ANT.BR]